MKNFMVRVLFLVLCFCPMAASAQYASQPLTSKLNIVGSVVIKATPGILVCYSVLVAGAVGAIHDTTAVANAAAGNKIAVIPAAVGYTCGQFPFLTGLVIVPGAAQVLSVSYQ
jgi:hypothetical protein